MKTTALTTLSANLESLRSMHPVLRTQAAIGKKASIDQRTVGRIMNGENQPRLDQLDSLAAAFGVKPWQLIQPDLKVMPAPGGVRVSTSSRWPFTEELLDRVAAADGQELRRLENMLRGYLEMPALPPTEANGTEYAS